MDKLKKTLNSFPKGRLGRRADLKIRIRLYAAIFRKSLSARKFHFSQGLRTLTASILLFIFIVVPGYAYAGVNVVPGDFLYPLKMKLEEIELSLARKKKKAEIYAEFSAKRLAEAKVLAATMGKPETEEKIKTNLDKALLLRERAISGFSDSGSTTSRIKALDSREEAILTDIAQSAGVGAEDDLIDSIALALDRVKNGKGPKNYKEDGGEAEKRPDAKADLKPDKQDRNQNGFIRAASSTANLKKGEVDSEEDHDGSDSDDKRNNPSFFGAAVSSASASSTAKEQDNISRLKKNIDRLKKDLRQPEFEQKDVDDIIDKLDQKIKRAEEIGETDKDGAQSLLRSAEALSDNAEHFIRKKGDDNRNKERGKRK
ncbi:MAG: DUF5667 domain-containing protein [Candidatus Falkowbacteria bacterium]